MEWFEKAWAEPHKANQDDWVRAQETAKDLIENFHLTPDLRILDLACGQGLEAIALALSGFQIEGRDLSQAMLNFATEHSRLHKAEVKFMQQDMRQIADTETFDAVMLRDVIWGIFDAKTNRDILRRLKNALKPNGKIIIEVYNKDVALEKQPIEGFLRFDAFSGRFSGKILSQNGTEQSDISLEMLTNVEWLETLSNMGFTNMQILSPLPFRKRGLDPSRSLINYVAAISPATQ